VVVSVIANLHSGSGSSVDSSNCQATNQYQSVSVVSADPGFQCNLYFDSQCQNFLQTAQTPLECDTLIGLGAICFSQALFNNPLAQSTAAVNIGLSIVTVDQPGGSLVDQGVNAACGSNTGCDSSTTFSKSFDHFNQNGVLTVIVTETYPDINTRDYMKAILDTTMGVSSTNTHEDLTGSSADNDIAEYLPSFTQVVIRDPTNAIQAQMTVTIAVSTTPASRGDCIGLLGTVTGVVLGEIPAVGGVAVGIFMVACLGN
jgi:hypothetical protein